MKRRTFFNIGLTGVSFSLANKAFGFESNAQWSTWRGENRDGLVKADWPSSLDEKHLVKMWAQPLGDSYSGPIASGDFVYTTESRAGKESAIAFDLATGEQAWVQTWKGAHVVPFFAARNGSWIRATPATDGRNVYVGGIRDVLVALDAKTGNESWRIDFGTKFGKIPDFGMVCSPVIESGHLYIQAGKGVQKVQCQSGEIVWTSLQDSGDIMSSGAFSSPTIAEIHGVRQLIVQTRTKLAGLRLDSGEVIWEHEVEAFRGMNILTPTIWNNQIFTSAYGGKSLLLDVSNPTNPTRVWENKIDAYMSSPVVIDNYLYLFLKNKRFTCLDLATGKEVWTTKPFNSEYWSLVSNGKSILALDQTGDLRLIAHNTKEYTLLSERRVSEEEAWSHVAVLPERVIVRSQKNLSVYRWV